MSITSNSEEKQRKSVGNWKKNVEMEGRPPPLYKT